MPTIPLLPFLPSIPFLPVLQQHAAPMAGHDRLDTAMFWVGALFVFTPVLVAIGVGIVVWYHRRKREPPPPEGPGRIPGES